LADLDGVLTGLPGRLRVAIERAEGLLVENLQQVGFEVCPEDLSAGAGAIPAGRCTVR
jgi:hypothetical protein